MTTTATCPKCLYPDPGDGVCPGCHWSPADPDLPPTEVKVVAPAPSAARTLPASYGDDPPAPAPAGPTDPTPQPTARPRLAVLRGLRAGDEYPLYPGRNTLGRFADQPVDVDLTGQEADGQVWSSRRHATVTVDAGVVLVEDLNSLNGTWVNGSRVYRGQPRPLKAGDVIQIGTVQLRLVV
ncbi:MAG: FHA domain-containing protein [Gemmataceae bacterium]|nr:FHA domain-containing protein [Gemmataceae bacterium]